MTNIIIIFVVFAIGAAGYFFGDKIVRPEFNNPRDTFESQSIPLLSEKVLNLSGKGLTKVPDYIFKQTEIQEFNLSNNSLGGALQAEIRFLQKLKVLDLSSNKFTGVPAEIGQLNNLEVLNLSNNKITGLPYELGNLSNLKVLDLSGNDYSINDLSIIQNKLPKETIIKTK